MSKILRRRLDAVEVSRRSAKASPLSSPEYAAQLQRDIEASMELRDRYPGADGLRNLADRLERGDVGGDEAALVELLGYTPANLRIMAALDDEV